MGWDWRGHNRRIMSAFVVSVREVSSWFRVSSRQPARCTRNHHRAVPRTRPGRREAAAGNDHPPRSHRRGDYRPVTREVVAAPPATHGKRRVTYGYARQTCRQRTLARGQRSRFGRYTGRCRAVTRATRTIRRRPPPTLSQSEMLRVIGPTRCVGIAGVVASPRRPSASSAPHLRNLPGTFHRRKQHRCP